MSAEESAAFYAPKHTDGPWQVGHTKTDAHMCEVMTVAYSERPNLMPSHKVICRTWSPSDQPPASFIGFSRQECLANARLIAAAPDLLAALEEAIELFDQDENWLTPAGNAIVVRWRAVVAKATTP